MMNYLVDPQEKPKEIEIGPYTDPKEFLQKVMAAVQLPLSQRMRAAIELLPVTHPKLAVVAQVTENDIATLLDRRIKRLQEMEMGVIEAKPINGNPHPQPHIDHTTEQTIETPKPLPRTSDRRYRRL